MAETVVAYCPGYQRGRRSFRKSVILAVGKQRMATKGNSNRHRVSRSGVQVGSVAVGAARLLAGVAVEVAPAISLLNNALILHDGCKDPSFRPNRSVDVL